MPKNITLTHPTIVDFYAKNPHLNVEEMNIMFIDILKTLSIDLTKTLENSKLGELQKGFSTLKDALRDDIQNMKKEYTDGVQNALKTNSLENIDKVSTLIEKNLERNTTSLVDKTSNILNDIIPRTNSDQQRHLEGIVKEFHNSISADTKRLLETSNNDEGYMNKVLDSLDNRFSNLSNQLQQPLISFISATENRMKRDDDTLKKIADGLDSKFNNLQSQMHEPIIKMISGSEERMKSDIGSLKETTLVQAREQEKMGRDVSDFLNKYKNSTSTKGAISENMLYEVLQIVFPTDEIVDSRAQTASGDFIVNRRNTNLPSILIENKDYTTNVDTREVTKFERDVRERKIHGIFLSQTSSITFKDLFQVDIIDGLIHVYVPNADFSQEKLNIAVKIIDNLSPALNTINDKQCQDDVNITMRDLERIAEEYRKFSVKSSEAIDFNKSSHNTMLNNLEELVFPTIQNILISTGKCVPTDPLTCTYCMGYTGKNKTSLGAHTRKCKMNPKSPLYTPSSDTESPPTPPPGIEVELTM